MAQHSFQQVCPFLIVDNYCNAKYFLIFVVRNLRSSSLFIEIKLFSEALFWIFGCFPICRVDPSRIKEVGPDRACAEWLLRCGASLRWKNSKTILNDYNSLPVTGGGQKIVEIDATDSAIMDCGFSHFGKDIFALSSFCKICTRVEIFEHHQGQKIILFIIRIAWARFIIYAVSPKQNREMSFIGLFWASFGMHLYKLYNYIFSVHLKKLASWL